ncbi:MAG: hypothetical protein K8I30_16725 [Anaerolineae bacterium]|nr:hypothetical protein [Anaerolineae bacterium]
MSRMNEVRLRQLVAVAFAVVGLLLAIWQTSGIWSIAHDCRCAPPYGISQGDYVGEELPRRVLLFAPFAFALLLHPIAGLIVSIVELFIVLRLQIAIAVIAQTDNAYWQFWSSSTWAFGILNLIGLLVSIGFLLWRIRRQW